MAIQSSDPREGGGGIQANDPRAQQSQSQSVLSIANAPNRTETGDSGVTTLTFPLSFDVAPLTDITVQYNVDIAGDVTTGLTQVVSAAGDTLTVDVTNDATDTGNRLVTVTLTSVTVGTAALGTATGTGTVIEDDSVALTAFVTSMQKGITSGMINL